MKLISQFIEGDRLIEQFLVGNVTKGVNTANSRPYLSLELRDNSGSIIGKKWEVDNNDEEIYIIGNFVEIEFEVLKYRDVLQLKIVRGRLLNNESIDVNRFIKNPPVPVEELKNRFNKLHDSIKDSDCLKILDYFMNKFADKYFTYPAASSIHHDYMSGLLMHSVSMAEIADYLSNKYDFNRDLVVTGALIHDMGKIIELEGSVMFHYSLEGKLLGHISIMVSELRKAQDELKLTSEIPLLLEHMVLSHHGQLEFGSPVLPQTKEAILLSLIDNLDSKMVITEKALENVKNGDFSQKVFPLDGRILYKEK